MKHSLKISLMALVAMFAFNTTADAQLGLGGLVRAAKKAVSSNKQTEVPVPSAGTAKAKTRVIAYDPAKLPGQSYSEIGTIFTMPGTSQKMMLIQPKVFNGSRRIASVDEIDNFCKVEWKDGAFWTRVEATVKDYSESEFYLKRFRSANDFQPNAKFKQVLIYTAYSTWKYNRDKWGNILDRYIYVNAIYEFDNGFNELASFKVYQQYNGSGYDDEIQVKPESIEALNGWEVRTDCYTSTLPK